MISNVRLSPSVQAVEVEMRIGKQVVRALVSPDALERHFKAKPSPSSWLAACQTNAEPIAAAVLKRWQATHKEPIVMTALDF